MTDRVNKLLQSCLQKQHHIYRHKVESDDYAEFQNPDISPTVRTVKRLNAILAAERPIVSIDQRIVFQRTVTDTPYIFSKKELNEIRSQHFLHELGNVSNICPNYEKIIASGLGAVETIAKHRLAQCVSEKDTSGAEFLQAALDSITAVYNLSEQYRLAALKAGNTQVAEMLKRIPRKPAENFLEALQFFRILHYTLWAEGEYHNTVGRFDQYMYPYLKRDLQQGNLTKDEAFELLEEFFITFNIDSDIYPGVQQGDDGQSLMLGGVDRQGNDAFNELSSMCLDASRELKIIDPKINLRVGKNTPLSLYEQGTRLTKEGLGFPQYSNDDVVVPALVAKGYTLEDARDYTVAACWEFIVPNAGMDIGNIAGLSFPKAINSAMNKYLTSCKTFDEFKQSVTKEIDLQCSDICNSINNLYLFPAPFMSVLMDGCIENASDISLGCKYNNYGIHGTGIATGADSMAAIEKYVFNKKSVSADKLVNAVAENFKGYQDLQTRLRYEVPKMGCDDDTVDSIAVFLLNTFANALADKKNERGGVFRAGTGSAMFYIQHAAETPASADGRTGGEPFGANFSPSLFAKTAGPLSIIKSFTKSDLSRTCNGGPLTMEFHSSLFINDESVTKVAQLVQYFILRGGHQFQLNAVNEDTLLNAQKYPEKYPQLVVRIWGWSAYFVELDKEYQDHVIARQEYRV